MFRNRISKREVIKRWKEKRSQQTTIGIILIFLVLILALLASAKATALGVIVILIASVLYFIFVSSSNCPNCNRHIRHIHTKFCPHCGVKLTENRVARTNDSVTLPTINNRVLPPPLLYEETQSLEESTPETEESNIHTEYLNPRKIREKLEMSQYEFAQAYHLDLDTLQAWENESTIPDPGSRVLLNQIYHFPEEAKRMIHAAMDELGN